MSNTQLFTPPTSPYLSVDGARQFAKDFCSYPISRSRFYTLVSEGKLPYVKVQATGRLLIPTDKFKAWLIGGAEVKGED